jgi:CheY-like chemotaxis protein
MSLSTVPYALAVDDDPFILMDVTGILEDAGFRTYEADHGDAAIAMLPEYAHTITLLFSDVDMPGDTNRFALAHHVAENYPRSRSSSAAVTSARRRVTCLKRRHSYPSRSMRR